VIAATTGSDRLFDNYCSRQAFFSKALV